ALVLIGLPLCFNRGGKERYGKGNTQPSGNQQTSHHYSLTTISSCSSSRAPTPCLASSAGKPVKDAGPAAGALLETLEIVFFIRRVDAIILKAEPDQKAVHAQGILEGGDNGDGCAAPHEDGRSVPFFFKGSGGSLDGRHVGVESNRGTAVASDELNGAIGGNAFPDKGLDGLDDSLWILAGNETARDLHRGLGRD